MQDNTYETNLEKAGELLRRNDRMHRRLFERRTAEAFGIHRSQHMTLMFISNHPDASQRDIAERFEISAAAVAVTLKKLEAGCYIVRSAVDNDCRRNQISLTEKGREVIDETHTLFSDIDRAMFGGLSSSEIACLSCCLEKMNENLRKAEKSLTEQSKG